jgi:hypothetical protein
MGLAAPCSTAGALPGAFVLRGKLRRICCATLAAPAECASCLEGGLLGQRRRLPRKRLLVSGGGGSGRLVVQRVTEQLIIGQQASQMCQQFMSERLLLLAKPR